MSLNQFPVSAPVGNTSVMAQTDQNRAVAEVQASLMIARMNPRDERSAMDRILNACTRQSLAEHAIYQYARGGTDISGASIRLAEAIAQQWGNIQFGIRELEQRNGGSTVQAFAWDVETNTRREVTFFVPHERYSRNGSKKLTDPRDIYEMVANQGSRRLRACILAIIPSDVTDAAVIQCEKTLISKADVTPDAIKRLVEAFNEIGVTKEQIEIRIQRRMDAIQPAQVANLRKIYASIRDGMSTPDEWFEAVLTEPKSEKLVVDVKPARKSKSSVDSLLGGQQSDGIKQEPISQPKTEPVTEPAMDNAPNFDDAPLPEPPDFEDYGTMPIPELVPESEPAKYEPNHVLNEWRAKIYACNSTVELIKLMNEMPPYYKQNPCKADLAKRQAELKEMEAQKEPTSIVNFDHWKNEITKCNSRDEFTALEKEMPPIVKDNEDIKKFMQTRKDFCMQNHPELW